MTLLELLMIVFVGIALAAWAVAAWAQRKEDSGRPRREDGRN